MLLHGIHAAAIVLQVELGRRLGLTGLGKLADDEAHRIAEAGGCLHAQMADARRGRLGYGDLHAHAFADLVVELLLRIVAAAVILGHEAQVFFREVGLAQQATDGGQNLVGG